MSIITGNFPLWVFKPQTRGSLSLQKHQLINEEETNNNKKIILLQPLWIDRSRLRQPIATNIIKRETTSHCVISQGRTQYHLGAVFPQKLKLKLVKTVNLVSNVEKIQMPKRCLDTRRECNQQNLDYGKSTRQMIWFLQINWGK